MQWALHHSWERRFTQCAVGPSSLLREAVYSVCSGPFIPLERGGFPGVQWAPHPSWERRFTQYAVGPSSLLREEVYPVCSGPILPLERGGLFLLCSGPFIPLERGGLPSVQWALHHSWERRFTQCAVGPFPLLREEVYLVCSGPFIPLERGGLPSVQLAPHPSWEMRFTQCAVGPSSLLRDEVYLMYSGPLIPTKRWGLPSVQMKFIDFAVCLSSLTLPDTKMRFTKCVVGPSSLLRDEVYQLCSEPLIPDRRVASRTPVRTCVHIVRESKKKNMTHQKKKQQVSSLA